MWLCWIPTVLACRLQEWFEKDMQKQENDEEKVKAAKSYKVLLNRHLDQKPLLVTLPSVLLR